MPADNSDNLLTSIGHVPGVFFQRDRPVRPVLAIDTRFKIDHDGDRYLRRGDFVTDTYPVNGVSNTYPQGG